MDTNILLNYGVLGIWTAYLLWEKKNLMESMKNMNDTLNKNNLLLDKLSTLIENVNEKLINALIKEKKVARNRN